MNPEGIIFKPKYLAKHAGKYVKHKTARPKPAKPVQQKLEVFDPFEL
jgi:hypothetical protein